MSNEKRCCPTGVPPVKSDYAAGGDDMYVAGPMDAKTGILLIGDIFGQHINTKHTVDDLAKAGYLVVMPDYFGANAMSEGDMADMSTPKWAAFFGIMQDMEPHYARTIRALDLLRRFGCTRIIALGLCWGSNLAIRLSAEQKIDCASIAHPSRLTAEAVNLVKTPLCIVAAVDDTDMDTVGPAVAALAVEPKFFKQYMSIHHGYLGARFDFEKASEEQTTERAAAFQNLLTFYERIAA